MKIVVMGGMGRVGARVVDRLKLAGHQVASASRRTGVDLLSGAGLKEALDGSQVVIDVSNSPSFEDEAALRFFDTATRRLLEAEAEAGVAHHIGLSIVGAERLSANGYFRAKFAQERQIEQSGAPYTILRATQFYEFLGAIVRASVTGGEVRVSPARIQPIAASDVADALANLVRAPAAKATGEIAGPDAYRLDELVRTFMRAIGDGRPVVTDPLAPYFGTTLANETLMAGATLRFGHTEFDLWLRRWVRENAPVD